MQRLPTKTSREWKQKFVALQKLADKHGHCEVMWYDPLSTWIEEQREHHQKLGRDRRSLLESLAGWTWDVSNKEPAKGRSSASTRSVSSHKKRKPQGLADDDDEQEEELQEEIDEDVEDEQEDEEDDQGDEDESDSQDEKYQQKGIGTRPKKAASTSSSTSSPSKSRRRIHQRKREKKGGVAPVITASRRLQFKKKTQVIPVSPDDSDEWVWSGNEPTRSSSSPLSSSKYKTSQEWVWNGGGGGDDRARRPPKAKGRLLQREDSGSHADSSAEKARFSKAETAMAAAVFRATRASSRVSGPRAKDPRNHPHVIPAWVSSPQPPDRDDTNGVDHDRDDSSCFGADIGQDDDNSNDLARDSGSFSSLRNLQSNADGLRQTANDMKKSTAVSIPAQLNKKGMLAPQTEWLTATNRNGRTYYYHRLTRERTWDKPEVFDAQMAAYLKYKEESGSAKKATMKSKSPGSGGNHSPATRGATPTKRLATTSPSDGARQRGASPTLVNPQGLPRVQVDEATPPPAVVEAPPSERPGTPAEPAAETCRTEEEACSSLSQVDEADSFANGDNSRETVAHAWPEAKFEQGRAKHQGAVIRRPVVPSPWAAADVANPSPEAPPTADGLRHQLNDQDAFRLLLELRAYLQDHPDRKEEAAKTLLGEDSQLIGLGGSGAVACALSGPPLGRRKAEGEVALNKTQEVDVNSQLVEAGDDVVGKRGSTGNSETDATGQVQIGDEVTVDTVQGQHVDAPPAVDDVVAGDAVLLRLGGVGAPEGEAASNQGQSAVVNAKAPDDALHRTPGVNHKRDSTVHLELAVVTDQGSDAAAHQTTDAASQDGWGAVANLDPWQRDDAGNQDMDAASQEPGGSIDQDLDTAYGAESLASVMQVCGIATDKGLGDAEGDDLSVASLIQEPGIAADEGEDVSVASLIQEPGIAADDGLCDAEDDEPPASVALGNGIYGDQQFGAAKSDETPAPAAASASASAVEAAGIAAVNAAAVFHVPGEATLEPCNPADQTLGLAVTVTDSQVPETDLIKEAAIAAVQGLDVAVTTRSRIRNTSISSGKQEGAGSSGRSSQDVNAKTRTRSRCPRISLDKSILKNAGSCGGSRGQDVAVMARLQSAAVKPILVEAGSRGGSCGQVSGVMTRSRSRSPGISLEMHIHKAAGSRGGRSRQDIGVMTRSRNIISPFCQDASNCGGSSGQDVGVTSCTRISSDKPIRSRSCSSDKPVHQGAGSIGGSSGQDMARLLEEAYQQDTPSEGGTSLVLDDMSAGPARRHELTISESGKAAAQSDCVQCGKCNKWDLLPSNILPSELPDTWDCSQNTWDPASATCERPEPVWVQCEKCNAWAQLAGHGSPDTLPDKWYCSLRAWDPTAADCAPPNASNRGKRRRRSRTQNAQNDAEGQNDDEAAPAKKKRKEMKKLEAEAETDWLQLITYTGELEDAARSIEQYYNNYFESFLGKPDDTNRLASQQKSKIHEGEVYLARGEMPKYHHQFFDKLLGVFKPNWDSLLEEYTTHNAFRTLSDGIESVFPEEAEFFDESSLLNKFRERALEEVDKMKENATIEFCDDDSHHLATLAAYAAHRQSVCGRPTFFRPHNDVFNNLVLFLHLTGYSYVFVRCTGEPGPFHYDKESEDFKDFLRWQGEAIANDESGKLEKEFEAFFKQLERERLYTPPGVTQKQRKEQMNCIKCFKLSIGKMLLFNAKRHLHGTVIPAQDGARFIMVLHALESVMSGHAKGGQTMSDSKLLCIPRSNRRQEPTAWNVMGRGNT